MSFKTSSGIQTILDFRFADKALWTCNFNMLRRREENCGIKLEEIALDMKNKVYAHILTDFH